MHPYSQKLIDLFSNNANSYVAFWAAKYMRNQFKFFGIKSPVRSELINRFIKENGLADFSELPEIIHNLWTAEERELQYFAMVFPEKYKKKWGVEIIELFEYMIKNKSWWDTVDFIASHLVGTYFKKYPDQIIQKSDEWMASGNIWLQRTCVIFQLKYKKATDTDLLFSFCEELKDSNEFFIRKAIGWALRELSKTNSEAVLAFVNEVQLKPLSEKEATRIIYKKMKIK